MDAPRLFVNLESQLVTMVSATDNRFGREEFFSVEISFDGRRKKNYFVDGKLSCRQNFVDKRILDYFFEV